MTSTSIQNSFSAGEISPSLFGRTDLGKFRNGAFTMRNFFANFRGGASSRAGFAYCGTSKQAGTDNPPRLITFQFNINQGYILEFGDQYMRILYRGAYITESNVTITGITNENPGVFTSASHGYSNGDWIFISGIVGMTNFNGLTWIVQNVTTNTFTVTDLFGNDVDTTAFSAYLSGGTSARIYTVVSPYAAVDLPYLKFTQSADTMSLTCWNQVTLTEYPIYDLQRIANTNWVFTLTSFGSSIAAPKNVLVVAESSTTLSTYYSYVVTAIDANTGQESIASSPGGVKNNDIAVNAGSNNISWTAVVGASSYNIYASIPSYTVPVPVGVSYGFIGSSFSTNFVDTNIIADFTKSPPSHQNPFARGQITSVNITAGGAGFTQDTIAYSITTSTGTGFVGVPVVVSGSLAAFVVQNSGTGYLSTDTITITGGGVAASGTYTFTGNPANGRTIILDGVTWTFTTGTPSGTQTKIGANTAVTLSTLALNLNSSANSSISLASYTASATVLTITYKTTGTSGNSYTLAAGTYGGSVSGATLSGGVNGADLGATATLNVGPQTGTYPGDVAYFQQRRVYADTQNDPDTYFMSQPGNYKNFDSSVPVVDSDSITGSPWAQQINGIQFLVPMPSGLIVLTGKGAWLLNGFSGGAITPSSQQAQAQAYNGCNGTVPPIVINYDVLYVQSKGSIVRDLSYNFYANIYTGTDTTVLSNHLFNFYQIVEWAYAEEPYKLVWAVRNDGKMLCLTYLKEQEITAWTRHDTNGFFVSVASVTEPPVDSVYVVVKRLVQEQYMYYIERMDNRNWQNAEDCFCVDSGLQYPMTFPDAVLTPSSATGSNNISSVNLIMGGAGYTSPVVTAIDSTGKGTGATFSVDLCENGGINAWNISRARYNNKFLYIGAPSVPVGVLSSSQLNSTGTKLYINGVNGILYQFTLGVAYDVSTATYDSKSFDYTAEIASTFNFQFNNSGTDLYILDFTIATIYQYSLSTPFDISTASYSGHSFSAATEITTANAAAGFFIGSNESKLYVCDLSTSKTYEYTVSSPGNISTASYASKFFNASAQASSCYSIAMKADGTKFYTSDFVTGNIYEYSLSIAFDITTAVYDNKSINSIDLIGGQLSSVCFSQDGQNLYLSGDLNNTIYQYNISNFTCVPGEIVGINVLTEGDNYTAGLTTLQVTDSSGSGAVAQPIITNIVSFEADGSVFTPNNVGDVIRVGNNNSTVISGVSTIGGGKAIITAYVSPTSVSANIIETLTSIITDDPNLTPVPAISGDWSVSTPVTTVSGLNHLDGLEVAILADGSVVNNQIVSNNSITLPAAASSVVIGLPYICQLQTSYLEPPGQPTVQGKRKNISSAVIRVEGSRGISVGSNQPDSSAQPNFSSPPWTGLVPIKEPSNSVTSGNSVPLLTKDEYVNIPGDWAVGGQVAVQQEFPLPANINAIISFSTIGDTSDKT